MAARPCKMALLLLFVDDVLHLVRDSILNHIYNSQHYTDHISSFLCAGRSVYHQVLIAETHTLGLEKDGTYIASSS